MMRSRLTELILSKSDKFLPKLIKNISTNQSEINFQDVGDKGIVILNRPQVLNALNVPMAKQLVTVLKEWESQKSLVIVKGAGPQAFCCGGDLRLICEKGVVNRHLTAELWEQDYKLVTSIKGYQIPYVAFLDGVAMGIGAGIGVNGRYRVATERTALAMPETRIGIFPDAGASYFLSRLDGHLGQYLALTGHAIKGFDVFKTGLATHYCDSKNLDQLEANLLNCSSIEDIASMLDAYRNHDKQFSLEPLAEKIDKCFSASTVEEIISRLKEDGSKWAENTIKILLRNRPLSLKVALKELEFGKQLPFDDCIKLETMLASKFTEEGVIDYEGFRTSILDKNYDPKWNPQTLSEISEEQVLEFFRS